MKDTPEITDKLLKKKSIEPIGDDLSFPVTTKKQVVSLVKGTTKNVDGKLKISEKAQTKAFSIPITVAEHKLATPSEHITPSHLPWMIGGAVVTTIVVAWVSNYFQTIRFKSQLRADYRRHLQVSVNETKQLKEQLDDNYKIINKNNDSELIRQQRLFEHERSLEEISVIREKKELFISTFHNWGNGRRLAVHTYLDYLEGKSGLSDSIAAANLRFENEVENYNKIRMLLDLYFFDNTDEFFKIVSTDKVIYPRIDNIGLNSTILDLPSEVAFFQGHIMKMDALRDKFIRDIVTNY